MNDLAEWLDEWCAEVPGLARQADGLWTGRTEAEISYPESGHDTLAEIEARSFWFTHRNAVIASIAARFPPQGPIFDIGGGNGFVSLGLAQAGLASIVVEPGAVGASNARARGLAVIQTAFQDLSVPAGSLPAAGLFDVLEHIEDDRGTLERLHDALEPDGKLYLTVPAHRWLWSQQDTHSGHFRRYSLPGLRALLEDTGFAVEFDSYFFSVLVPAVFAFRTLPSLFGRGAKTDPADQQSDHALPSGLSGRIVGALLERERRLISSGASRRTPGTSCLVAARRV
jgi:SAM-dependent methyltransferase